MTFRVGSLIFAYKVVFVITHNHYHVAEKTCDLWQEPSKHSLGLQAITQDVYLSSICGTHI